MKTLRQQLSDAESEVKRLKSLARCKREPMKGTLGGIIQQLRELEGWTLHELARRSGVAAGLVSRIETNPAANPTLANILKISHALDRNPSELFLKWEAELAEAQNK